ncbi:MAG: pirin family protein [Hyphomonadaceae bacterium]
MPPLCCSPRYHFSFYGYHEPNRVHWGALSVWNDDTINAKSGFPLHLYSDMDIITYARSSAIRRQDSLGNKGRTTEAGDVQVMSAGLGRAPSTISKTNFVSTCAKIPKLSRSTLHGS